MNTQKSVFNKISKIEREVESKEVELSKVQKVELGAIDDLRDNYQSIAAKAVPLKRIIEKAANDLEQVAKDLRNVESDAKKLESMAKELGADDIVRSAQALQSASKELSSSWSKAAQGASSAAKEI